MAKLGISQILEKAEAIEDRNQRVEFLRQHSDNMVLKNLLRMVFDHNLHWDLPVGAPPYRPCDIPNSEINLYNEYKKLYVFWRGNVPNLKPIRREYMFVQLLESLHPKDAELLLYIKDHKLPYTGMTKGFLHEVWPELI
jgi:hypothetical protein